MRFSAPQQASHGNSVKFVAALWLHWSEFGRVFYCLLFSQVQLKLVTYRRRLKIEARWDENVPWPRDIWCQCLVDDRSHLSVGTATTVERWLSRCMTMVYNNAKEDFSSLDPYRFLISVNIVLNHFTVDPAITPISSTGYQLVTMCRSIYAEERAQIFEPPIGSKFCFRMFHMFTPSPLYCILCCLQN